MMVTTDSHTVTHTCVTVCDIHAYDGDNRQSHCYTYMHMMVTTDSHTVTHTCIWRWQLTVILSNIHAYDGDKQQLHCHTYLQEHFFKTVTESHQRTKIW